MYNISYYEMSDYLIRGGYLKAKLSYWDDKYIIFDKGRFTLHQDGKKTKYFVETEELGSMDWEVYDEK